MEHNAMEAAYAGFAALRGKNREELGQAAIALLQKLEFLTEEEIKTEAVVLVDAAGFVFDIMSGKTNDLTNLLKTRVGAAKQKKVEELTAELGAVSAEIGELANKKKKLEDRHASRLNELAGNRTRLDGISASLTARLARLAGNGQAGLQRQQQQQRRVDELHSPDWAQGQRLAGSGQAQQQQQQEAAEKSAACGDEDGTGIRPQDRGWWQLSAGTQDAAEALHGMRAPVSVTSPQAGMPEKLPKRKRKKRQELEEEEEELEEEGDEKEDKREDFERKVLQVKAALGPSGQSILDFDRLLASVEVGEVEAFKIGCRKGVSFTGAAASAIVAKGLSFGPQDENLVETFGSGFIYLAIGVAGLQLELNDEAAIHAFSVAGSKMGGKTKDFRVKLENSLKARDEARAASRAFRRFA